jgi:hypothetical protein
MTLKLWRRVSSVKQAQEGWEFVETSEAKGTAYFGYLGGVVRLKF